MAEQAPVGCMQLNCASTWGVVFRTRQSSCQVSIEALEGEEASGQEPCLSASGSHASRETRRSLGTGAHAAISGPKASSGRRSSARASSSLRPQVDDLDGTAHYKTLGVEPRAGAEDIKRVRGAAARRRGCRLRLQNSSHHTLPHDPAFMCCPFSMRHPLVHPLPKPRPTASWQSGCTRTRAATLRPLASCKPRSTCWGMHRSGRCTTHGPRSCNSGWFGERKGHAVAACSVQHTQWLARAPREQEAGRQQ